MDVRDFFFLKAISKFKSAVVGVVNTHCMELFCYKLLENVICLLSRTRTYPEHTLNRVLMTDTVYIKNNFLFLETFFFLAVLMTKILSRGGRDIT